MARSDFLVRMKADTKDYDRNVAAAKKQLDGFTSSNFTAGGQMKQMTSMLVSTAAKFATFGAAVAAAMKLFKDSFFNSEQSLDEWGRTVASSESLYKGFLNALNTGNISGYLSNMNSIAQAAREAYNALDELATYNAFNRANMAEARFNYTEAVADFREGKGSKDSVKSSSQALIKELETRQKMETDAYEAAIKKLAAERGVSAADLRKVMTGTYGSYKELKNVQLTGRRIESQATGNIGANSVVFNEVKFAANERERLAQALRNINDTELDALQALAETAKTTGVEINNQRKAAARILNGQEPGAGGGGGKSGGGGKGGTTALTGFNVKDVAGLGFADAVTKELKKVKFDPFGEMLAGQGLDSKMFDFIENLKNNLAQADVGTAFYSSISGRLADAEGLRNLIAEAITDGVDLASVNMDGIKMKLFNAEDIDEELQALVDYINNEKGGVPIKMNFETGAIEGGGKKGYSMEDFEKDQKNTQQVVSGLQSVASGLQQMGIKLPEGVQNVLNGIQGAMSVIQGVMSIIQVFQTSTVTTQIASQTANTSALIALTAAVGANTAALGVNSAVSIIPFAKGGVVRAANGVVPGQSWANDRVPALLNSGELVLNKAQAGVLGSLLSDKKNEGMGGVPYVSGEQIYLGLSNYLRRTGRGELLMAR